MKGGSLPCFSRLCALPLLRAHVFSCLRLPRARYRCGCAVSTEDGSGPAKYEMASAAVFNHLMVGALQRLIVEFR